MTVNRQVGQLWLAAHLGQVKGSGPLRMAQPQSVQVSTSSPNIPRTMGPHLAAPQGPVPMPVRRLTVSKVFAPARMALSTIPLRILLHRQIGRYASNTASSLAFLISSDWSNPKKLPP